MPDAKREGYTFEGWVDEGDNDVVSVTNLNRDITLYATWSGENVNYQIIYWVEAPNMKTGEQGEMTYEEVKAKHDVSGWFNFYRQFATYLPEAPAGTKVSDIEISMPAGIRYISYSGFSIGNYDEIRADGSTIINAYFTLDVFDFEFELTQDGDEMHIGGVTYTPDTQMYSFKAKFGEDISELWPSSKTADPMNIMVWEHPNEPTQNPSGHRYTVTEALLYEVNYVFQPTVRYTALERFNEQALMHYYIEPTVAQSKDIDSYTTKEYAGKTYIFHDELTQYGPVKLTGLNEIEGMEYPAIVPDDADNPTLFDLHYRRDRYNVHLDYVLVGIAGTMIPNVMYGEQLNIYQPLLDALSTKIPGYEIEGWYYDTFFVKEFDIATAQYMPVIVGGSDALTLYAKLVEEEKEYHLTFVSQNGDDNTTIAFGKDEPTSPIVNPTHSNEYLGFGGWYEKGSDTPFVFGATLSDDIVLYAKWVSKAETGLTVTHKVNVNGDEFTYEEPKLYGVSGTITVDPLNSAQLIGLGWPAGFYNADAVEITIMAGIDNKAEIVYNWKNDREYTVNYVFSGNEAKNYSEKLTSSLGSVTHKAPFVLGYATPVQKTINLLSGETEMTLVYTPVTQVAYSVRYYLPASSGYEQIAMDIGYALPGESVRITPDASKVPQGYQFVLGNLGHSLMKAVLSAGTTFNVFIEEIPPTTYEITYHSNHADVETAHGIKSVTLEEEIGSPMHIALAHDSTSIGFVAPIGLTLAGWNTQSDGKGTNYEVGESVPESVTSLYALWNITADETIVVTKVYDSEPMETAKAEEKIFDVLGIIGSDASIRFTSASGGEFDVSGIGPDVTEGVVANFEIVNGSVTTSGTVNFSITKRDITITVYDAYRFGSASPIRYSDPASELEPYIGGSMTGLAKNDVASDLPYTLDSLDGQKVTAIKDANAAKWNNYALNVVDGKLYTLDVDALRIANKMTYDSNSLDISKGEIAAAVNEAMDRSDITANHITFSGANGDEDALNDVIARINAGKASFNYSVTIDGLTIAVDGNTLIVTPRPYVLRANDVTRYFASGVVHDMSVSGGSYDALRASEAAALTERDGLSEAQVEAIAEAGEEYGPVSGDRISSVEYSGSRHSVGSTKITIEDVTLNPGLSDNYELIFLPGTLTVRNSGSTTDPDPEGTPDPTPDPTPNPDPTPDPETLPTPNPEVTPLPEPETLPTTPAETIPPATIPVPEGLATTQVNEGELPFADGSQVSSEISDSDMPTGSKDGAWALLNLILTIVTALISISLIVGYFERKRNEEKSEQYYEEEETKRKGLWRLASILPTLGATIAFILTQDMTRPMQMADNWTLLMVAITLIQFVLMFFSRKKKEERESY